MSFFNFHTGAKTAPLTNTPKSAELTRKALNFIAIAGVVLLAMSPELALAAPWDNAANKVLEIFTGGLARTLAIIGVIACGIAALAGKLSWDWAIKIILGIVLIFGAAGIVDYMISGLA